MGTRAVISIYKPKVHGNQWSSGRLKLTNSGDSIEAGWMVNPGVFKDDEPHFYAKYSAGRKGCINTECPGYVQVDMENPLGQILHHSIINGKNSWVIDLTIEKHEDDGNWWLSFVKSDGRGFLIGYWPKTLFSTMVEAASQIEWGGEIYNPGASKPQPEMGSGKKATYITATSAYIYMGLKSSMKISKLLNPVT
ncbi:hypothetical protein RND81_13G171800 [Saponaria officinalis]|uniref:Neprosin PEP catalytic domain-containing protein n=1 Tax=Saponaria officinalis TaxID=3572 RepID=A0AAW1H489_SAPOF